MNILGGHHSAHYREKAKKECDFRKSPPEKLRGSLIVIEVNSLQSYSLWVITKFTSELFLMGHSILEN